MAKITIQTINSWLGWFSNHQIYIDDQNIGRIMNGGSKSFDVSPGNHILQIKIGLFKLNQSPKITFSVNDAEEIKYEVSFTLFSLLFEIIASAILIAFLILHLQPEISYLALILFAIAFLLRERCIKITEVDRLGDSI